MARIIAALFSLFALVPAFAQDSKPEVPLEPVNTVAVVAFLALFFGSILAYVVYLWWTSRHKNKD